MDCDVYKDEIIPCDGFQIALCGVRSGNFKALLAFVKAGLSSFATAEMLTAFLC